MPPEVFMAGLHGVGALRPASVEEPIPERHSPGRLLTSPVAPVSGQQLDPLPKHRRIAPNPAVSAGPAERPKPAQTKENQPVRPIRPNDCKAGALPAELWPLA
jgi:hypothetical protein